jgi:nucleotide-binding universal stress UspA family protein
VSSPKSILLSTDFSDPAEAAFHLAYSLARDRQARLIVLHVIPPPLCHGEVLARMPPDSYYQQMKEWLYRLQEPGGTVEIDYRLKEGDPCAVIVQTAVDVDCDLIVMGTHGRTGLSRAVLGSVAEQVLRRSPCPVLTIRMPSSKCVAAPR